MGKLKPCPLCGFIPRLAYCCGEYFIVGKYSCCSVCGDSFTEMHSSDLHMIEAWNMRCDSFNKLVGDLLG